MKKTDLAYIAGLIDGEGCITVNQRLSRKLKLYSYCPSVQIAMTDKEPLELLQYFYGGKIYLRAPAKDNHKAQWHWYASGEKAYKLLGDIKPYLIIKKAQAEVLQRIFEGHPRYKKLTPIERFLQQIDVDILKNLKKI